MRGRRGTASTSSASRRLRRPTAAQGERNLCARARRQGDSADVGGLAARCRASLTPSRGASLTDTIAARRFGVVQRPESADVLADAVLEAGPSVCWSGTTLNSNGVRSLAKAVEAAAATARRVA